MARTTQATQTETPATETAAPAPAAETTDTLDFGQLRAEAAEIRVRHGYRGKLTNALLLDLEALLNTPIPEGYLLHSAPTEGKPYHSTGLKSIQVQVDIANAVLGSAHWRLLTHYKTEHVCHAWVIIGNNLLPAKLIANGEEVEPNGADILTTRDGWGGVKRSNHEGDGRKGAQTNASKRALAQAGPGSNVYRLDFDEELVEGNAPANKPGQTRRAQPRTADTGRRSKGQQQTPTPDDDETKLAAILATDDPLKELRADANKGMDLLAFPVRKRVLSLEASGGTEEELRGLIERTSMALEARDAGELAEAPA